MSPDENRPMSVPDAEVTRIAATVHQLILMRETGPKSAAWHRARVQTIWRLQQRLAVAEAQPDSSTRSEVADQCEQAEAQHDQAADPIDPA